MFMVYGMDTIIEKLVFPVLRHFRAGEGSVQKFRKCGDEKGKKKKNFGWDKVELKIVSRLRLTELWQIILFL